jgi:hypothetical protein
MDFVFSSLEASGFFSGFWPAKYQGFSQANHKWAWFSLVVQVYSTYRRTELELEPRQ